MSKSQMQQHIQFHNNKPSFPITSPSPRHFITQVKLSSFVREDDENGYYNTVISPKVDAQADIEAINLGKATHKLLVKKDGDIVHSCFVNGRIYGIKSYDGKSYPISGQGLYELNEKAYVALGILNEYGNTQKAGVDLKQKQIEQSDIEPALKAWVEGGRLNRSLQSPQQSVVTSPVQVTPQISTKNQLNNLKQVKPLENTTTPTVTQSTIANLKTGLTSSSSPSQQSHQVAIAQNNKKPKPNSPSMS